MRSHSFVSGPFSDRNSAVGAIAEPRLTMSLCGISRRWRPPLAVSGCRARKQTLDAMFRPEATQNAAPLPALR
jgi:hypothetical protein